MSSAKGLWCSIVVAALSAGCGGSAASRTPAQSAASPSGAPSAPSAETAAEAAPQVEIPPAPASCAAYSSALAEPRSCSDFTSELARALALTDKQRDAALAMLEGCSEIAPGVVRSLRIELLPVECGDVLAEPWLKARPQGVRADVRDALAGAKLAAHASRLVRNPPQLEPPMNKQRVLEFMRGPLMSWIRREVAAIHQVSKQGASLDGYGKAVVAVEAGLADMRFVEVVREAPVPDEIKNDREASEVYYAALDDALEPRKTRGRDAALVGLGWLAQVGVIADPRVDRARALLSKVYSGRRIDALDALLLPPLPAFEPRSPEERIAASVSTFHLPLLLARFDVANPRLVRAATTRGVPSALRTALTKGALGAASEPVVARAVFELGRTYWRATDFATAAEVAARHAKSPDMPLVAALGKLLAKGPKHAGDMILGGPHLPSTLGQVAELEQLAAQNRSLAGYAHYDAALLLELASPPGAEAKYFEDIAARYAKAEKQLPPEQRARASERARAAADTAKAIASER